MTVILATTLLQPESEHVGTLLLLADPQPHCPLVLQYGTASRIFVPTVAAAVEHTVPSVPLAVEQVSPVCLSAPQPIVSAAPFAPESAVSALPSWP